jgi:hypothetical protein
MSMPVADTPSARVVPDARSDDPMLAAIDRALRAAPPPGGALSVAEHIDVLLDLRLLAEDLAILAGLEGELQ